MRIPALKTLSLAARWLRSRFVRSALILGYHRIAETQQDPYSLCVTPKHFAEHLDALVRHANPIRLQELVEALRGGNIPRRAVAITFDDGYADALHQAKPLLEHYGTPATVFVVAGYVGREFWWDRLARILLPPATLPLRLYVRVNDRNYSWSLDHTPVDHQVRSLLVELSGLLQSLSDNERQRICVDLQNQIGVESEIQPDSRALTRKELNELVDGGLVEIGAHTIAHPVLSTLPVPVQQSEIQQSKRRLEEVLGREVFGFSYPHGSSSLDTVRIVKGSGFKFACTSLNDVIWRRSNPFNLPRFWIPNCDGTTFSRWLARWLPD
jgi:peptidoglycan/xylan/chitin deacetylase (PgdA/CDA1 family)